MKHIVLIDGMNQLHRARSGWSAGPAPVIFNFMRNFRSLIELMKPDEVYFVLEGHPKRRLEVLPEYKGNREIDPGDDKKIKEMETFYAQVNIILGHLRDIFPVHVVHHPDHECDDVIANLIAMKQSDVQWTVISNDSDFHQLLNEHNNVRIYNPMQKSYVETPDFDYVVWKSLKGDASDNVKGIVSEKKATTLMDDPVALEKLLSIPENAQKFNQNYSLIKFEDFTLEEFEDIQYSHPKKNWQPLYDLFTQYQFNSLLKESSWNKFTSTFDHLWENFIH